MEFNKHIDLSLPHNYLKMYSSKIIADGIRFLNIKDANEIYDIIKSAKENRVYLSRISDEKTRREEFLNRFAIPANLSKKEYKVILDQTQDKIDSILARERTITDMETKMFIGLEREDYIEKKSKLKAIIKSGSEFGEDHKANLEKAKAYPIDQLVEFNSAGLARCVFHSEKTASMKLYKKDNRAHCFGCHADEDSVGIAMKVFNLTFNEAIKRLL